MNSVRLIFNKSFCPFVTGLAIIWFFLICPTNSLAQTLNWLEPASNGKTLRFNSETPFLSTGIKGQDLGFVILEKPALNGFRYDVIQCHHIEKVGISNFCRSEELVLSFEIPHRLESGLGIQGQFIQRGPNGDFYLPLHSNIGNRVLIYTLDILRKKLITHDEGFYAGNGIYFASHSYFTTPLKQVYSIQCLFSSSPTLDDSLMVWGRRRCSLTDLGSGSATVTYPDSNLGLWKNSYGIFEVSLSTSSPTFFIKRFISVSPQVGGLETQFTYEVECLKIDPATHSQEVSVLNGLGTPSAIEDLSCDAP